MTIFWERKYKRRYLVICQKVFDMIVGGESHGRFGAVADD